MVIVAIAAVWLTVPRMIADNATNQAVLAVGASGGAAVRAADPDGVPARTGEALSCGLSPIGLKRTFKL
jgi:hypothetical protein